MLYFNVFKALFLAALELYSRSGLEIDFLKCEIKLI